MSLIRAGSQEWEWNINLREMARIWKGGCIIRARFLDSIMRAFERQPDLPNLLLDSDFMDVDAQVRAIVAQADCHRRPDGNPGSRPVRLALVL